MGGDVDGLFGGEGGGVTGGSGRLSWDSPGLGLLAFGSVCTSIRVILNDEHSTGNIQVSALADSCGCSWTCPIYG